MADYKVTDTELTSIANAIRAKGGTQAQLEFPTGFVSAVQAIPTGGGGGTTVLHGSSNPLSSQGENGNLYLKHNVPPEVQYNQKSFISRNGNSPRINTNISAATENLKIKAYMYIGRSNSGAIFGGQWSVNGFFLMIYGGAFRFHSGGAAVDGPSVVVGRIYEIIAEKHGITIDGVEYPLTDATGVDQDYPVVLNHVYNGSQGSSAFVDFGEVEMWDGETLLRKFSPYRGNDGNVGMYDSISESAFYSYSDGNYIPSGDVGNLVTGIYVKRNGVWLTSDLMCIQDVGF